MLAAFTLITLGAGMILALFIGAGHILTGWIFGAKTAAVFDRVVMDLLTLIFKLCIVGLAGLLLYACLNAKP